MLSFSQLLAKRYINSNNKNYFFSWITVLAVLGIAIGIAAMILVLSLLNGFETELRDRFLAANAHILVYRYPSGIQNHEEVADYISKKSSYKDKIRGVSPFVHYETMVKYGSISKNVLVRGIDPVKRKSVQDLMRFIKPKESIRYLNEDKGVVGTSSVIIGSGLRKELGIKLGEALSIVSPNSGSFSVFEKFVVRGFYDSGLEHYDGKLILMSVKTAQRFFQMKSSVTGLEIGLKDPADSKWIAKKIRRRLKVQTKPWQNFNAAIFNALEMERAVIAIIVALVALVASFNIFTTLFVSVSQKQQDISVLKALGASNFQVMKIFLMQGAIIGAIGSLLGAALALFLAKLIVEYQIIKLPSLYVLAELPIQFDPLVYLYVISGGVFICILAGLYPSWLASKQNPADGFRHSI